MEIKKNIILIGSISHYDRPETIGGATVLFNEMVCFFKSNEINFSLIVANKYKSKINSLLFVIRSLFKLDKSNSIIVLNVSQNGFKVLYPLVYVFCKIFAIKLVLRVFGSHAYDVLNKSLIKSILLKMISNTDCIFLETKLLVKKFNRLNRNVEWFPNVRKKAKVSQEESFKKRFVYLGHIKKDKGILDLINVFNLLNKEYNFSFYGSITDDNLLYLKNHESYGGIISSDKVNNVLKNNDVLILPTYYEGEGYPGVIIEAYMLGLPVITTKWKSIPEIVEDYKTGILIEPQNLVELRQAITFFNEENYSAFRDNALYKSKEFETNKVHKDILEKIYSL